MQPIPVVLRPIPVPGRGGATPAGAYQPDSLRLGQQSGAEAPPALRESFGLVPRTVVSKDGRPGDPINLVLLGSRDSITRLFQQAGWLPADPLKAGTGFKMVLRTLDHKPYPTAPVSSLYLYKAEHRQDLAFERPTATTKVRDHIRIWDSGRVNAQGQAIWLAAATKDIGIERNKEGLGPTHRIDPDVDAERDLVGRSLVGAGATALGAWSRGPLAGRNGGGDPYTTDGRVLVLRAPV
ncbi:MAG: LssY C-terminal domain-containing protein [Nevskia sp.]|nr:LssY C-terminal domain-containing protein [Nevskia sp.]